MPSQSLEARVLLDISGFERGTARMQRMASGVASQTKREFQGVGRAVDDIATSLDKFSQKAQRLAGQALRVGIDPSSAKAMNAFLEKQGVIITQNKRLADEFAQAYKSAHSQVQNAVIKTTTTMEKQAKVVDVLTKRANDLARRALAEGIEPTFKGMTSFLEKQNLLMGSSNQKLVTQFTSAYRKIAAEAKAMADEVARQMARAALADLEAKAKFPSMVKGGISGFRNMTKEELAASSQSQIALAKAYLEQGVRPLPTDFTVRNRPSDMIKYPPAPPNQLLLPSPEMVRAADAARLVTKSTDEMNKKFQEVPNAVKNAEAEFDRYAKLQVQVAKERGISTMADFEAFLGRDKLKPTDPWFKFDQRAKEMFGKTFESAPKDWKVDFISNFVKEASDQGIKTLAQAKQKLMQAAGGQWTGLEDRALLAFGRSIGLTGKAYTAELDKMAKVTPKTQTIMKTFFGEMKDEISSSAQLAMYRVPMIGGALAGTFRTLQRFHALRGGGGGGGGDIPTNQPPGGGDGGGGGPILLNQFGKASLGLTAIMAGATVAAGTLTLAIGKRMSDQVAKTAEEYENMGKVVNISGTSLSALSHAAAMQGEDLQGLQRALVTLNDKMQQAVNDRVVRAQLKNIGIEAIDPLTGKVKATLPALFEMSDELARMGDTSERTAKIMDVFGSVMAARIIRMFGEGSPKLAEFMEQAKRLGLVLDEQELALSRKYKKSVLEFTQAWEGLKTRIALGVMPVLTELFALINSGVSGGGFSRLMQFMGGSVELAAGLMYRRTEMVTQGGRRMYNAVTGRTTPTAPGMAGAQVGSPLTGGASGLAAEFLNRERQADAFVDPAMQTRITDAIFDASMAMKEQITSLNAQEVALRKGSLAAKEFEMRERHLTEMGQLRQREAYGSQTEQVIADRTRIFEENLPAILRMQAMLDKLQGNDWQTQITKRNDELNNTFRRLEHSVLDTVTAMDPGERAFKSFEQSVADLDVQLQEAIRNAESYVLLYSGSKDPAARALGEAAAARLKELEELQRRVRNIREVPGLMSSTYNTKLIDDAVRARKEELQMLELDLQAVKALTSEEKIRIEVDRQLVLLKRQTKGMTEEELKAARERLTIEERNKKLAQDRVTVAQAVRQQRESIEMRIAEFKYETAITAEEKAQAEMERKILELQHQGRDVQDKVIQKELEHYRAQQLVKEQVDDIIRRYQELAAEIEGALHNAVSSFGSLWDDVLDKVTGNSKKSWREIAYDFVKSMRDAANDITKSLFKAMIDNVLKQTTGKTIDEWIKEIAGGIAGGAVKGAQGETPEQALKNAAAQLGTLPTSAAAKLSEAGDKLNQVADRLLSMPLAYAGAGGAPAAGGGIPFPLPQTGGDGMIYQPVPEDEVFRTFPMSPVVFDSLEDTLFDFEGKVKDLNESLDGYSGGTSLTTPVSAMSLVNNFQPDQGSDMTRLFTMLMPMIMSMIMGGGKGRGGGGMGGMLGGMLPMIMGIILRMREPIIMNLSQATSQGISSGLMDAQPEVEAASNDFSSTLFGDFSTSISGIGGLFRNMFGSLNGMMSNMFGQPSSGGYGMAGGGMGGGGMLGNLGGLFSGVMSLFNGGTMASSFGYGVRPEGVMGPTMANGGFFSSPMGGMGGGMGGGGLMSMFPMMGGGGMGGMGGGGFGLGALGGGTGGMGGGWGMLGGLISMGGQMSGNKTAGQVTGGLGGALQGAQMGSYFGPWGALGGAIIGGLIGAFSNAEGGYQPSSGMGGGVATKPMRLLQFAERAPSEYEAVVPLKDNKSIPVTLNGDMPFEPGSMGGAGGMGGAPVVNPPAVSVNILGDMVDPASKGLTPEEAIEVVFEDIDMRGGKLRDAIRRASR